MHGFSWEVRAAQSTLIGLILKAKKAANVLREVVHSFFADSLDISYIHPSKNQHLIKRFTSSFFLISNAITSSSKRAFIATP